MGPGAVVKTACLESRRSRVWTLLWPSSFLLRSIVKNLYCWELPWPRDSVLGLRPPGAEWRIMCLEGSVILFISVNPQEVLMAQFSLNVHKGGLKPYSFHFYFTKDPIWLIRLFHSSFFVGRLPVTAMPWLWHSLNSDTDCRTPEIGPCGALYIYI